jgi:hypothetical protein
MKTTVKRWCKDFGYAWYGPGIYSDEKYDYKIHFGAGEFAMFRTAHGPCLTPRQFLTKSGKSFLIFPVFTQFVGQKEMSRKQFSNAVNWVRSCLDGHICEFQHTFAEQGAQPDAYGAG